MSLFDEWEAAAGENSRNRGINRNNTSGTIGVNWHTKAQRWTANIRENGKYRWLGSFHTKEEAIAARSQAQAEVYGEFTRTAKK